MADNLDILIRSVYNANGMKLAETDLQRMIRQTELLTAKTKSLAGEQVSGTAFTSSRREFMMGQRLQGLITQTAGLDSGLTRTLDGFERLQFMAQASNLTVGQMLMKFGPMAVAVAAVAAAWKVGEGELAKTNKTLTEMGLKQISFMQFLKLGVTGNTSFLNVDGANAYARAMREINKDLDVQAIASRRIVEAGEKRLSVQVEIVRQTQAEVEHTRNVLALKKQIADQKFKLFEDTPSGSTEMEARIKLLDERIKKYNERGMVNGRVQGTIEDPEEAKAAKEQMLRDTLERNELAGKLPLEKEKEKKRAAEKAAADAKRTAEQEQKNNEETQKKKDEAAERSEKARLQSIIEDTMTWAVDKEKAILALAELEKKGKTEGEQKLIDLRAKQQIARVWEFKDEPKPERFVPRALDVQTDSLARIGLLVGGQSPMAGDNHAKRGADSLEKMVKDGIIIRNLSRDWVN